MQSPPKPSQKERDTPNISRDTPLIFEQSAPGRKGVVVPECDVPKESVADLVGLENLRRDLRLPEVGELQAMRHFTNLSHRNYGIDTGFYPLGSCTMKYNPRINESVASDPHFTTLHPLQPPATAQGALEVMHDVMQYLQAITGFDTITLQPAAGAHGEMLCLMFIKAYHHSRGEGDTRTIVLVPDSAHGTNPASAARCSYSVRSIKTDANGNTDLEELKAALGPDVAALMLTNPSTAGVFEENIKEICELAHAAGAMVFCDGANMNAIVGIARPADMGFDCMHLNLHKTFSTPHGGGGPGCGAIGVSKLLDPFLPTPVLSKVNGDFVFDNDRPNSIGRVHSFYGNFLMVVRAWSYIRAYGGSNLREIARHAVLNANYIQARLKDTFPPAFDRHCMHECVLTGQPYRRFGVRTLDIAKRLIDYGFHPPTIYFPLIVPEAIMIEPTETETRETLDAFCDAMLAIAREAVQDPEVLRSAPHHAAVGRLDEASAVRHLNVRWKYPQPAQLGE